MVQPVKHAEFLENVLDIWASEVTGSCSFFKQCKGDIPDVVLGDLNDVECADRVHEIFLAGLGLFHFLEDGGQLNGNIHFQSLVNLRKIHEI